MTGVVPRVVVLMATYNGARHIEDQISSILGQRDVCVRLVVRDDGSTDTTTRLVADLAARHDDKIEILADDAGSCGSAAANFFAMLRSCTIAPGDRVALADQDDIWFPDKLARAVERMDADATDGYSSNLIAFNDDDHSAWQVRKDGDQRAFDYLFQGASAGCTYVLSARGLAVVQAGIARMIGTVPPYASHDWLIYALCRSAGLRWTLDDRSHIAYRQHTANVYGTRSGIAKIVERLRLLRSRWYRNAVLWLCTALDMSAEEQEIMARVERLTLLDRLWLARRAVSFRRNSRDARQLQLALLTGLFR